MKKLRFDRSWSRGFIPAFATVALTWFLHCGAAEFSITNSGFETPIVSDGAHVDGIVPGWTGIGTFSVANPANDYFSGTTGSTGQSPIEGFNAVAINTGGKIAYQDPALVIQPNTVYRMTFLAGYRIGVPFGTGSASFWSGSNLLAEAFPSPPQNKFISSSLMYTSPPSGAMISTPLRIELRSTGTDAQAWFDDLHLFIDGSVCTPHKAIAAGQLVNGIFVGANITDPGCGYTNPPAVLIKGGGGNGATARAVINDGRVVDIFVTSGGCCYTNTPQVLIASPPFVPKVSINVSRITVNQNVVLGWKYVLESSTNNVDWLPTGPSFIADSESLSTEFPVDEVGKFFRLKVVP